LKPSVPPEELRARLDRFRARMEVTQPVWELALVVGKVNLYYFTGTMQDGLLIIPREDEAVFWVRRSYERALAESWFPRIHPMGSFRDAAASLRTVPPTVYLETETVPLAHYQRLQKYFPFSNVQPADPQIGAVRSIKSPWELARMEQAGAIHRRVLEERVPLMLHEGMSEADLGAELFRALVAEGHHGVARFGMFDTEILIGHVAFGESSLYPTYFNGPGGNYGLGPAVPLLGNRERTLKKGDLVFIDIGCGVEGYHTDKTTTYAFGTMPSPQAVAAHHQCLELHDEIATQLRPGAVPSQIYKTTLARLDTAFLENFMGFGQRRVKFLGHGIGLQIDEPPVIAEGFDEPLQEGITLAVEPKKGIPGVGMVGIENTFLITAQGGRCLTGDGRGLILV
jgi:Xaa-Pro aminopeptidase